MADAALDRVLGRSRYSNEDKARIENTFVMANDGGIGEDLLIPRVQEALAKRVKAEKLIEALAAEIDRLYTSRSLLLESAPGRMLLADDSAWQRTANLLAWGVAPAEISGLIEASGGESERYQQASSLYTSLMRWGLSAEESFALSKAAGSSNLEPDEYLIIIDILIQGRRRRLQSEETVARLLEELPLTSNPRQLRKKVIK